MNPEKHEHEILFLKSSIDQIDSPALSLTVMHNSYEERTQRGGTRVAMWLGRATGRQEGGKCNAPWLQPPVRGVAVNK